MDSQVAPVMLFVQAGLNVNLANKDPTVLIWEKHDKHQQCVGRMGFSTSELVSKDTHTHTRMLDVWFSTINLGALW